MCFKRNTSVPLFCFMENLFERKRTMKSHQKLWNSVSLLIVAVLAITCFVRGNAKVWFYLAAFLLWSVLGLRKYLVPMIKRYKYTRETRQTLKQLKKEKTDAQQGDNVYLSHTLLCHVNHRVTGYLKSIYPDATWKWVSDNPANIIAKGGTGRIELFNVKEYNFADISFDTQANIECSLLKVVSFKEAAQTEVQDSTVTTNKPDINPQVWFEKSGRVILKNLIADLSSRGHNTLTITDDGSCIIEQGDKKIAVSQFETFPERVYHPKLIKVLAGAGISAQSVDAGLSVTW